MSLRIKTYKYKSHKTYMHASCEKQLYVVGMFGLRVLFWKTGTDSCLYFEVQSASNVTGPTGADVKSFVLSKIFSRGV
jgi:hypothetical protein